MKAREELRLVERFDELRAGMIVVLESCRNCGGMHRGMLLRFCIHRPRCGHDYEGGSMTGWVYAGDSHVPGKTPWFGPLAVDERRLFRVVDGLESDTSTAEQAPVRQPERVR